MNYYSVSHHDSAVWERSATNHVWPSSSDQRPPHNRWNTKPGQEDSRRNRNQFSSWAKVGEDTLDEAAPHHFDHTYIVKTWARLYACDQRPYVHGPNARLHEITIHITLLWGSVRLAPNIQNLIHPYIFSKKSKGVGRGLYIYHHFYPSLFVTTY